MPRIPRTLFGPEHDAFRHTAERYFAERAAPHRERWEAQGHADREAWLEAGALGLLCPTMPEHYGGAGADRLASTIIIESQALVGGAGLGFTLHSDIVAPYLLNYGSEHLKQSWLPRMARGEVIGAIAMTEPGTGSDLQAVRATATPDGDDYVLNGSKTFITNGYLCDFVLVVCRTENAPGGKGLSLLLVEANTPGFSKGKPLKKVGQKAQDIAELFFDNVRVPRANIVGAPGQGFALLMTELAWERLIIAIGCVAAAEKVLADTIAYTRDRQVFGRPVADYQNTRFTLAELAADIEMARVFVDRCIELECAHALAVDVAAMAKLRCSELNSRVADRCVQLFGGYGYIWDTPVARAFADARVHQIYGGTSEIMKELISRVF